MDNMTTQEFASKFVHDKSFKDEVLFKAYDYDIPEGAENGIGLWCAAGASKMGYDFDPDELDAAIKAEADTLGAFKKFGFIGGIINSARKKQKSRK